MSQKFDPNKNYYGDLELQGPVSIEEVKKQFRKLGKKYHPDANSKDSSEEKFKKISEAYQILSDEDTKSMYDLFKFGGPNRNDGFSSSFFDNMWGSEVNADRQDSTFSSVFVDGEDIEIETIIELKDAFSGIKKEITVNSGRMIPCSDCEGTGASFNSNYVVCGKCVGRKVKISIEDGCVKKTSCENCNGQGKIPLAKCLTCKGSRRHYESKSLIVNIPPGVADGSKLRIAGQGKPGINASPGDLYVIIKIEEDSNFKRDNLDLYLNCRLPLSVLLAGGKYHITHLNGNKIDVEIPKNLVLGSSKLKLPGYGMSHPMRRIKGDLYLTFEAEMPKIDDESIDKIVKILNSNV